MPADLKRRCIVGDQNKPEEREEQGGVKTLVLPYDCGLSYARNTLVNMCTAPYVLLLEDDFEFTDETDIGKLRKLMDVRPDVGIVAGQVQQMGVSIPFEFIPTVRDGVLYHMPDTDLWWEYEGIKYKETGSAMNFALFRSEMFDDILWDADLKLREHQDFYLRFADTKWRLLYTPEVVIKDAKTRFTPEYRELKNRDEYLVKMMQKHGLHKIKYQNGSVRILEDGKIIKSHEPARGA